MNYDRPELRDRLAAEYVLGTMHGKARTRFQRLMRRSLALRLAVEAWEARLLPMAAPLSGEAPGPALWKNIEARIGGAPSAASSATTTGARASTRPTFGEIVASWLGLRQLGALAAGIVLGVAAMLAAPLLRDGGQQTAQTTQLPASYAGFLADTAGAQTMLVSSLRYGTIVDVKVLRAITVPPDRVLVLWALPRDAAPLRLGVVPATGKGTLTLPAPTEQLLSNVAELAVSLESRDATGGAPTEPFLLRGPCGKFW
jgi:anti-sigma-K factor RskA